MDVCRYCGGKLDCCNESEIVCPWCGEADCWLRLDELIGSDRDDSDLNLKWEIDEDTIEDDSS